MKTSSIGHETDVQVEPVVIKLNQRKRNVMLRKGLSVRPQKSLHKAKSIKPRTLLPDWLARKSNEEEA